MQYSALVNHALLDISINAGHGTTSSTMAGMTVHALPWPIVDVIIDRIGMDKVTSHIEAILAGVRELGKFHIKEGRRELTDIYRNAEHGFTLLLDELKGMAVDSQYVSKNIHIVTFLPEALAFIKTPTGSHFECSCGCGCCWFSFGCGTCAGCGCTLGYCLPPSPCGCGVCLGCGGGFGCCCGCGCGWCI